MSGNDSDSSDEEWVTSSVPNPPTRKQQLKISAASIRTLQAALPKQPTDKEQAYISPQDLDQFCQQADSVNFSRRLIETYKNAETYLRIREIETSKLTIDVRLCEHLHECPDPGSFILQLIYEIAVYCKQNPGQGRNLKFQRYLVQALCRAFQMFLATPPTKYRAPKNMQEKDLISFVDEPNLISFDDDDNDTMSDVTDDDCDDEDDDDDESEDDDLDSGIAKISLAQLLDIPPEAAARYTLGREHQEACVRLLDTIPTPVLVYYAMDVFKLNQLVGHGEDLEEDGIKLCTLLMRDGHYNEAISCIRKLDLFEAFPIDKFAAKMFAANQGGILPVYTSGHPHMQRLLLEYINIQLQYTFAGNLGIVPADYLKNVNEDEASKPPLPRLRERRFQKELTACAAKVLQEGDLDASDYYFIWLAQRYATLRWIIKGRAVQQYEENDMSIAASSNHNGLVELLCNNDPALSKLAIKEFVDMNDSVASTYFANLFGQQQFFVKYHALPLRDRSVGMLKGETLSTNHIGSPRRSPIGNPIYYKLPNTVRPVMVDSHQRVMQLKATLTQTRVCGLDTEWVPQFARTSGVKTALMQIASDCGIVYLVDIATALHPTNIALLQDIDLVLRMMFESLTITKLAYDFHGDFALLKECMPTASEWHTVKLLDFKSLRTHNNEPIPGGLSGVVSNFLGVTMNKKQQLSNWEQRPLTLDQANYAASDAYCLIEIYNTLISTKHPFIQPSTTPSSSPRSDPDLVQF